MKKFDEQKINDIYSLFYKYYCDTKDYRQKCRDNEEFWKAQHWSGTAKREENEPQPVTPVIFSTLENMLADIMDNYPRAIVLGQESNDENIANCVSGYVEYILKRRNFRSTYRDKCRELLKKGMSITEVFWDSSLYNELGDINIKAVDIENFVWQSDICDIQDSKAVFKFYYYDKQWFIDRYGSEIVSKFKNDVHIKDNDFNNKDREHMLLEYWYKTYDKEKKSYNVHMARFAGHMLLEFSEEQYPFGIYSHGKYPFIIDTLYKIDGKIMGLSFIDIFKNLQIYADKLDQIIVKNALMSGKMKMLINRNAEIDEASLTDWSCEVVRGNRIDDGSVRWFQPAQLSPSVMVHYNNKLSNIKEESGQNLFNRGDVGKGVTAASAIMALQEAGSKRSRLIIDQLYDTFEIMVSMVIDLICENYTEVRRIMIDGKSVCLDQEMLIGNSGSFIDFDICIHVEKQTPYKTLYQNELALSLLNAGVFMPSEALEFMNFEGKDKALSLVKNRNDRETE